MELFWHVVIPFVRAPGGLAAQFLMISGVELAACTRNSQDILMRYFSVFVVLFSSFLGRFFVSFLSFFCVFLSFFVVFLPMFFRSFYPLVDSILGAFCCQFFCLCEAIFPCFLTHLSHFCILPEFCRFSARL